MRYDPHNDPRFVPGVDETILERDLADIGDQIEKLEGTVARFEAMQQIFESAGWAYFSDVVTAEAELIDTQLVRAREQPMWMFLRGQRVWCDFILQMPATADKTLDDLRDKIAALSLKADKTRERQEGM